MICMVRIKLAIKENETNEDTGDLGLVLDTGDLGLVLNSSRPLLLLF